MFKPAMVCAICVLSLAGCASFIASGTGSLPVGVETGQRSLGQVFIDSSIERTANINLYKLDPRFKQARINVVSFHSSVLLTGQVPDIHLKQLAEDNVRAMSDVKAVHNYISVGDKVTYTTIMQDAAVTANTKGLIMKAPVVSASKVRVHTEDGVLYILGRLNTAEINDLAEVLQKVGDVSKIVTLIDNIDLTPPSTTLDPTLTTPLAEASTAVATPVAIDPAQPVQSVAVNSTAASSSVQTPALTLPASSSADSNPIPLKTTVLP